jgi:hypothetical protein
MTTTVSFDVGTRTLSVCIVSKSDSVLTVLDWRVMDLHGEDKKLTMHDLSERCVAQLMKLGIMEKYRPSTVLIETQRGGKFGNATMVSMSHVLHACVMTSAQYLNVPCAVVFMSPTLKVAAAVKLLPKQEEAENDVLAAVELTTRQKNYQFYKKNKKASKDAVALLIPDETRLRMSPELKAMYVASKKKDDLADSFMQAYAHLNAPIPEPPAPRKRKRAAATAHD